MTVWRLITREIAYRKINFVLAAMAVAAAAAVVCGSMTLLAGHDVRTENLLAGYRVAVAESGKALEEEARKSTRDLGYNVIIQRKDQVPDLYSPEYSRRTLGEDLAQKLADSNAVTIEHILPVLEKEIDWPEGSFKVLLVGVRGEVPIPGRDDKKPLMRPVGKDEMIVGFHLAAGAGLKIGDKVSLMGEKLRVAFIQQFQGGKEDLTAWAELHTVQRMLNMPGRITAILALNCNCDVKDARTMQEAVADEITRILPETSTRMLPHSTVRARIRAAAKEDALRSLRAADRNRGELRAQISDLAAVLTPLAVVISALLVAMLALGNVRERRVEIGILRALGTGTGGIMAVFLVKAAMIGLIGAAVGAAAGLSAGAAWSGAGWRAASTAVIVRAVAAMLAAPLVAALASWPPAALAAGQDPAAVLSQE